jgi:hypothetical protein
MSWIYVINHLFSCFYVLPVSLYIHLDYLRRLLVSNLTEEDESEKCQKFPGTHLKVFAIRCYPGRS